MSLFNRPIVLLLVVVVGITGSVIAYSTLRNQTYPVQIMAPEFQVQWDFSNGKNAGWKLDRKESDFDAHYVLEVPEGEKVSIIPEFECRIVEGNLFGMQDNWVSAFLPLYWDGKVLDLEPGTNEPSLSHFLHGTLRSRSVYQRINPHTFAIAWRMRYFPDKSSEDYFAESP
jgi:hypothetical protein